MKISVIVPVYNVEKYIDKCLNSLVNQTLTDIEIIVVNDGSPDNSQIIIDEYVKKYPKKVKSFIVENGGQGSARNFGLQHAGGDYIGYVDSDDYVELDMYEKLYNKAIEGNYDIVICGNYSVSEDYKNKLEEKIISKYCTDLENVFFGKMAVWNKIYKKELIVNNGLQFKSKVWYEDLAFSIKAALNSKSIAFIDKPLYNYLVRQGSTMNNSNIQKNLDILDAFNDVLSTIKENNYENHLDKIEFLAIDHIYISSVVRVLRANSDWKNKMDVVDKLIEYMNNNFPNFKQNKYLKTLSRNRKIIYLLVKNKKFKLIQIIFNIAKK